MSFVPLKFSLVIFLFLKLECFCSNIDTCYKSGSVINDDKTTSFNIRAPKQTINKVSFKSISMN